MGGTEKLSAPQKRGEFSRICKLDSSLHGRFHRWGWNALQARLTCLPKRLWRIRKSLLPFFLRPSPRIKTKNHSCLSFGRVNALEVCLAQKPSEIRQAQALRYQVFYEEMSAIAQEEIQRSRLDRDAFDQTCDHLLVLDHNHLVRPHLFASPRPSVVGTYRILRQESVHPCGGFYAESSFALTPLLTRHSSLQFMEVGRSCVLKSHRNKKTIELLWHGVWSYVLFHRIDVMIGCASIEGTDPERIAPLLSFLHHYCSAPEEWAVQAAPRCSEHLVEMDRLPKDAVDTRAVLRALPPLLKGYVRLGAFVGHGAVIDPAFQTIDVLIIMPVKNLNKRYVQYYGSDASRYAPSPSVQPK